jgi:D-serine/D-alanine/glycine transporter
MRILGELLLSNLNYKSFRDAVDHILGLEAGFITGWLYLLFWIVTCVQDSIGVATYIRFWAPATPVWLVCLLLMMLVICLNIVTVRLFGELEFWFAIIKVFAISVILITGAILLITSMPFGDGGNSHADLSLLTANGGMFPLGFSGFMAGFQLAFIAYGGIEMVGTAAAETENPTVNLPKAINALPLRVCLFYVGAILVLLTTSPWNEIPTDISPFVVLWEKIGVKGAAPIMNVVLLTAAMSGANSGVYASSRMLFGLAKSGQAPARFGKLSTRAVPYHAILAIFFSVLPFIIFLGFMQNITDSFVYIASVATNEFIFVWILIMVTYLKYLKVSPKLHKKSVFKAPAGKFFAYFNIVVFSGLLVVFCFEPQTRQALLGSFISLIIVLGICKIFKKTGHITPETSIY